MPALAEQYYKYKSVGSRQWDSNQHSLFPKATASMCSTAWVT